VVLAIDPGLAKCGIAVVAREPGQQRCRALHREVAPTERLVARVLSLLAAHPEVTAVLIGNATNGARLSRALREALADRGLPLHAVEEAFTSQRARVRFQQENPPRGLSRLVPAGLRSPPCPYDDYVAILLAEDWFGSQATGPG
jgi:RNase H-fold protein (predicted Holliday junction resolvase)